MIDLFFEFVSLTLLVLGGWYVFRNYFYHELKRSIRAQAVSHENLQKERERLHAQQQNMTLAIKSQEDYCKELTSKITTWNLNVEAERAQELAVQQLQQEKLKVKREIQAKNYHDLKLKELLTPEVMKILEHDLDLYFADQKNLADYQRRIHEWI